MNFMNFINELHIVSAMRGKTSNAVAVVYETVVTALLTYRVTIILQTLGERVVIKYIDNDGFYFTYNQEYFDSERAELFPCKKYYAGRKVYFCITLIKISIYI